MKQNQLVEQLREISSKHKKDNDSAILDREIKNIENMLVEIAQTGVFKYTARGLKFPYEVKKCFKEFHGLNVSVQTEIDNFWNKRMATGEVTFSWE